MAPVGLSLADAHINSVLRKCQVRSVLARRADGMSCGRVVPGSGELALTTGCRHSLTGI